jgi:cellulose synthase/poly-beta-1,6-N-acetylglucosamine synthase-like glycosyltransferase
MSSPLVSVIVPAYNGERYLGYALQSILNQDYRPPEVIVVDGSVDRGALSGPRTAEFLLLDAQTAQAGQDARTDRTGQEPDQRR